MSEARTIARPYAKAVFRYAQEQKTFSEWDALLNSAAMTASDPAVVKLLNNPAITSEQLTELFVDVSKKHLNDARQNFLQLLADRNRLDVLPEIAQHFEEYVSQSQRQANVKITAAYELSDTQQQSLREALQKRLEQEVNIEIEIDPTLLAGAVIRCGDLVIDGSLNGRFKRLVNNLAT